jgi:uncharacterized protein YndB with AHSA1/START domain
MSQSPAEINQLTLETDIAAAPERVWRALTENIGDWWPAEFFAGGNPGSRHYVLEAKPGGRMYETWDDGGGVLWGTVVTAQPNCALQVLGTVFPNWGGPNLWYGSWNLEEKDGGTKLTFSESAMGKVSPSHIDQKTTGWTFLWNCLKAHVEGSDAPVWGEAVA